MKIIQGNLKEIEVSDNICIALGTFDGVHRGHQKIIKQTVRCAEEKKIKSAVMTFNQHPLNILGKGNQVKIITDNYTKARIIETLGVDYLFLIKFDREFANIKPEEFINLLITNLKAKSICCGYNYTFGKDGIGNTLLLNYFKDKYNYEINIVEKVTYNNLKISSSIIREKLEENKIREANALLGYNYFCYGTVREGKKLGNKLGFPTANLIIPNDLCLKNGVYISLTEVNGITYPSISNIGYAPTIESYNGKRSIETHLLNYNGDMYGKNIKVEFVEFIREEMKFSSVSELKDRVLKDIQRVKKYFYNNNIYKK